MATVKREMSLDVTQAFSSGAAFAQELGPVAFTITRADLLLEANLTTSAAPGITQDYLSRAVSALTLSSPLGTHLALQDMRPLHFENKFLWADKFVAPAAPGASSANAIRRQLVRVDFGVNPQDPYDLTAGIPQGAGNLTLGGSWATPAALGSGVTVNSLTLRTTLFGVQGDGPNDPNASPKAIPIFQSYRVQPQASTGSLGSTFNVPKGHFWHSTTVLVAAGAAPSDNRSDAALSDIGLVLPVAGNATRKRLGWHEFKQDSRSTGIADDDGSTFGSPVVSSEGDVGVGYLNIRQFAAGGNPLYGADMRSAGEGDAQIAFGVAAATNLSVWLFMRQYDPYTGAR